MKRLCGAILGRLETIISLPYEIGRTGDAKTFPLGIVAEDRLVWLLLVASAAICRSGGHMGCIRCPDGPKFCGSNTSLGFRQHQLAFRQLTCNSINWNLKIVGLAFVWRPNGWCTYGVER